MKKIENLFLSVGAMKAGTTWLYDKLQHNPQIEFSYEKEIHFLSHQAGVANSLELQKLKRRSQKAIRQACRQFDKSKINEAEFDNVVSWYLNYSSDHIDNDWYINLFPKEARENSQKYCADFSNLTCFLDDEGWDRARSISNNIKTIYILRDPISRLWSHYKFHLQFVDHDKKLEPDAHENIFNRIVNKEWFIRNSKYSENVNSLRKNLSPSEFKIFYLEDISKDPNEKLKEIEDYLGISNFDYSELDLFRKNNSSISKRIPEEWLVRIKLVLGEELDRLKELGIFHDDWIDF